MRRSVCSAMQGPFALNKICVMDLKRADGQRGFVHAQLYNCLFCEQRLGENHVSLLDVILPFLSFRFFVSNPFI